MSSPDSPRSRRRIVLLVGLALAALLAAGVGVLVWSYRGDSGGGARRTWITPTGSGVLVGGTF